MRLRKDVRLAVSAKSLLFTGLSRLAFLMLIGADERCKGHENQDRCDAGSADGHAFDASVLLSGRRRTWTRRWVLRAFVLLSALNDFFAVAFGPRRVDSAAAALHIDLTGMEIARRTNSLDAPPAS
jgi:hypothetical protein